MQTLGGTEEQATTLCTTNQAVNGLTLQQAVSKGRIPSSDYETAGLKVTYENGGGTDVVIPSQIDGKTVISIGNNAFKNNSSIVITNNSSIENTVGVWENIFGVDVCTGDVAVEGNVITYIYNKKPC